jgi:hypothetical protein
MSVHNWDISSQHLEQRHLTSEQNNLPDCLNFGRLRWPFYYFYIYRQLRGRFKSSALLKPYFLINNGRKKCSQRTDVATHRTREVCSSPQQHHSSISSTSLTDVITQQRTLRTTGATDRTTPAQHRRVFLEYKELKALFSMHHQTSNWCDVLFSEGNAEHTSARRKQQSMVEFQTVPYGRVSNCMVPVSASFVINTTARY